MGLGHPRRLRRLQATSWHGEVFALANEDQVIPVAIPIDAQEVAQVNLLGSQKISQRINYVPFDSPLQVPCAIALVRAFLQQELFARAGDAEQKLALGRFQHPLLDLS